MELQDTGMKDTSWTYSLLDYFSYFAPPKSKNYMKTIINISQIISYDCGSVFISSGSLLYTK